MSGLNLLSKKHCVFIGKLMFLLLGALPIMAQTTNPENVGIGTTKPDRSALLDLTSTTKGLLIPRMTLAQRGNIPNPATGLMIYQTDFLAGFYFFDGSKWQSLAANVMGQSLRAAANDEGSWGLTGNTGLSSDIHFVGTTDTSSLAFRVNNLRSGFIDYRYGNTYFGYRAGYRSSGFNSVAIGAYALHEFNTGLNNVAVGYQSLPNNTTGSDNVAVGTSSLFYNSIGSQNVAIGSQAGQRSIGDGNLFIGNRAGANEVGSNKLYIDNGNQNGPLLYGDFLKGYIGINTKQPESALTINSRAANVSGLQLLNMTSASPAGRPNMKVLSVDDRGQVILVRDSIGLGGGITTSIPNYWTAKGNSIENNNNGDVIVGNIRFKNLRSTSAAGKSNLKVLSVDENGLLVLVKDSVGVTTNSIPNTGQPSAISGFWNETDNNISNTNTSGKVILRGGVQLQDLTAYNRAYTPYGKVLTVDDFGNLLLVRDSVGVGSGPSSWSINGSTISNNNAGRVYINNGLTLPQLTSQSMVTSVSQKFLTVDTDGNVILANVDGTSGGTGSNAWALSGTALSNSNTGVVTINNGLTAKNGIKIETGGLSFSQLRASSPASKSNGKVLSLDDNGNLILVRDSVGVSTNGGVPIIPSNENSQWTVNDNNISNKNTGNVYINNGLILPKLTSDSPTSVTSQKVLSVDATGRVILVNTPTSNVIGGGNGSSLWKTIDNGTGIVNSNTTGGIYINSNEDDKSGLQFVKLKAASAAGNSYGKVLSVDDYGNVILVNDAVGGGPSGQWDTIDGRLHSANNSKVVIGTGINSFPDGFSLYVKGGILTERVRVAVANSGLWADYVFQDGYNLMPLKDVEKFVKYNHHLPNVPSAEEVAKNGLDLTATSAKLMEKVEELTLYLIEANKRIEALEEKMKNLEKIQK